jgi:hypothetical protein
LLFGEYQPWLALKRKKLIPIGSVKNMTTFGKRLTLPLGPSKFKFIEQNRNFFDFFENEI